MKRDILNQLRELTDVSHVFVLTHNIDFVFVQTVLLSALARCGQPKLVCVADAGCASQSFDSQWPVVSGLGTRYRVIPYLPHSGLRFHPKAVLAIGKAGATLFVGSGNLTFGGLRENVEVWMRFDADADDGRAAIGQFREILLDVAEAASPEGSLVCDVAAAFDPSAHPWAGGLPVTGPLIFSELAAQPMLSEMLARVDAPLVDRVTIMAPYFDEEGVALRELVGRFPEARSMVLLQDGRSTLTQDAAENLPKSVNLSSIEVIGSKPETSRRFIHAKLYAFGKGDRISVFAGSANCSRAALLRPPRQGNVELMAWQEWPIERFDAEVLSDFHVRDERPTLPETLPEAEDAVLEHSLLVTGAHFQPDDFICWYVASAEVAVTSAFVDGEACPVEYVDDRRVRLVVDVRPNRVRLRAHVRELQVESNEIWVNDEGALARTGQSRNLIDAVSRASGSGVWTGAAWALILERLNQDMEVLEPGGVGSRPRPIEKDAAAQTYVREDVFSETYSDRSSSRALVFIGGADEAIATILLRAFGIGGGEAQSDTSGPEADSDDDQEEDDMPDRPSDPRRENRIQPDITTLSLRERRHITELTHALTNRLTSPDFLVGRAPRILSRDIEVIAILLRLGYSRGWLLPEEYFELSRQVFAKLFHSHDGRSAEGGLEARCRLDAHPNDFAASLCSAGLSAAIHAWALAEPSASPWVLSAQRAFSTWLGAGRVPWVWKGGDPAAVISRTQNIVRQAPSPSGGDLSDGPSIEQSRTTILRRGQVLHELETALNAMGIDEIRGAIEGRSLVAGDLLWQAQRSYCLVARTPTSEDKYVEVYCLQDPSGSTHFLLPYAVPVSALLESDSLASAIGLDAQRRQELFAVLGELKLLPTATAGVGV